jgi:hypothetical protein
MARTPDIWSNPAPCAEAGHRGRTTSLRKETPARKHPGKIELIETIEIEAMAQANRRR